MKIINKPQYVIVLVVIVEVTVGLFEKLCQPKLSNEDVILYFLAPQNLLGSGGKISYHLFKCQFGLEKHSTVDQT